MRASGKGPVRTILIVFTILVACGGIEFTELRHDETRMLQDGANPVEEAFDPFRVGPVVVGVVSVPPSTDLRLSVLFYGDGDLPSIAVSNAKVEIDGHQFDVQPSEAAPSPAPESTAPLRSYVDLGAMGEEALAQLENHEQATLRLHVEVGSGSRDLVFTLEKHTHIALPNG
jgi:hypothetical protein